jgi:serine/threonine-protein kinase SRPK3
MNGTDSIKKAAIQKAKQVAQAANGSGGKKRRKGQDLKPIITTEGKEGSETNSPTSTQSFNYR